MCHVICHVGTLWLTAEPWVIWAGLDTVTSGTLTPPAVFLCLRCGKWRGWWEQRFSDGSSEQQATIRWDGDGQWSCWHGIFWRGACKPSTKATAAPPPPSVRTGTSGQLPWREAGCCTQTTKSQEPTGDQHQGEPTDLQPAGMDGETGGGQEDAEWCKNFWVLQRTCNLNHILMM